MPHLIHHQPFEVWMVFQEGGYGGLSTWEFSLRRLDQPAG